VFLVLYYEMEDLSLTIPKDEPDNGPDHDQKLSIPEYNSDHSGKTSARETSARETPRESLTRETTTPRETTLKESEAGDPSSRRLSSSLEASISTSQSTPASLSAGGGDDKSKLAPKVSFKARKQTYKIQKKKVAKELSTAIKDKSVTILSSWLKIRGTLKSWAKYWCVVKPEVIIVYKSDKHHHWVGTVLINNLEMIERPSSKEGFCFKIFQPYGQSIWATKGPKGELAGALVQPMPKDHLIFRAPNEEIGRCWLDALEVAQRSSLINAAEKIQSDIYGGGQEQKIENPHLEENEHVYDDGFVGGDKSDYSSGDDLREEEEEAYVACAGHDEVVEETPYTTPVGEEEFGESGETTEEMEEENKSILWALLKQVRPGMDLSKVTLPTFILEPRSFLDKLADYYYHSDYLAVAGNEENPYLRIKQIVKWYISGFYKKPKGLKKPYNPIIGEVFRCMWPNDENSSRTFFIGEQVSHHPPVSAFYCSNRKDGYVIGGSILAKSKFYGNSSSAILDGVASVSLLKNGEDYSVTMPYAHVKGILIGSLTAEYGGVVNIKCEKTGYNAEIEFKLKPFWKKSGESNYISGKIRMGNDVLSKIEGRWDSEIFITEYSKTNRSGEEVLPELFFAPTPDVKKSRLKRFNVDIESQEEHESEYLWRHVSAAIKNADQLAATNEKLVLENNQRKLHKDLKEANEEWVPRYFERDLDSSAEHAWVYKYKDLRPWDLQADLMQFEDKGVIKTQTKHRVPLVKRSSSSPNILNTIPLSISDKGKPGRLPSIQEPVDSDTGSRRASYDRNSMCSTRSEDERNDVDSPRIEVEIITRQMKEFHNEQKETVKQLTTLRLELRRFNEKLTNNNNESFLNLRDIIIVLFVIFIQYFLQKFFL